MNIISSPFSSSRYEHDGLHLYYIKEDTLSSLESDTPIIITGSRGTGKTTLLNALNWNEQKFNPNLIKALDKITHRNDYIGIYLKVPILKIESFEHWEKTESQCYTLIFSLYLELVWLQEAISAIIGLQNNGNLAYTAQQELSAVDRIKKKFRNLFLSPATSTNPRTLLDLSESIIEIRKFIEDSATFREDIDELYKTLSGVEQYGEISNYISKKLAQLSSTDNLPLKFKVCMDECESLSEKQILVINTLLRISSHPVFYVFSFIGKSFDSKQTLIRNLTNQKADVLKINLDDMKFSEFEDFADGVSKARISAFTKTDNIEFSIKKVLGKGSINNLLEKILRKSESPRARKLIKAAKENYDKEFYETYRDEGLPIYQSYLVDKLNIDINKYLDSPADKRTQESKEIRKRMVAAYLSICKEFNTPPLYAYSYMVYRISDISIRDYIWQLDEIFKEANLPLEEFINAKISVEQQDKGIKRASLKKLHSIESSEVKTRDPVEKLVIGLGNITEIIQTKSADISHLRSSERGIFGVLKESCDGETIDLIQQSSDAGFIKILESNDATLRFRVHNSLSAEFGFSYRGAYYDTNIKSSQLKILLEANNRVDLEERAKEIAESIYNITEKQPKLL